MIVAVQLGVITFFLAILVIIYQDERRRRREEKKCTKLNRVCKNGRKRRKSVRLGTIIDVSYEVLSGQAHQKGNSISRNISIGGINLALDEKLMPETTLTLQLNLPQAQRPISAQGKIVWVKEISKKFINPQSQRFFATGIKFTQLAKNDEAALESFIKQSVERTEKAQDPQP